jgi:hypothetical protein
MSIAELIMTGTNRASESTAWVGDSLAKLGQQVGASLAQREQQKQAQEMLPFLQQSMQESMTLAGSGKTGEAYSKLMPFLTDPSTVNNPYVLPAIGAASKFIDEESNNFLKKEQLRIQEGMYNARYGGGGGEPQQSGAEQAYNFMTGNARTTPVGGGVTSNTKTSLTQDEQRPIIQAAQDVTNSVLLPDEVPQKDSSGLPAISTPDKWMEAQTPFEKQEGTPYQQASASNLRTFEVLPPDQKSQIVNQSVSFDPGAEKYEYKNIDLGEWGVNIGRFGIPKVGTETILKKSARGSTDKPGMDVTFTEERIKVGEQQYKDANDFIKELITANSDLSRDRPSKDLPTFKEIFKQNGGILNATIAPIEQVGMDANMKFELIPKSGAAAIPITETQAKQIKQIQGASEIATGTGLNLSPSKKMETAEAPAPTQGGLPATQPQPAVEVPEEAMELQKIVEQGASAKAAETAKNVEKRIKDIDIQIKRLASPTTIAYDQAGLIAVERPIRKTPEEAQADIQKIAKLKSEKDALQGKPSNQKEIKEGDIVVQGKKRYKFTNGKFVPIN